MNTRLVILVLAHALLPACRTQSLNQTSRTASLRWILSPAERKSQELADRRARIRQSTLEHQALLRDLQDEIEGLAVEEAALRAEISDTPLCDAGYIEAIGSEWKRLQRLIAEAPDAKTAQPHKEALAKLELIQLELDADEKRLRPKKERADALYDQRLKLEARFRELRRLG